MISSLISLYTLLFSSPLDYAVHGRTGMKMEYVCSFFMNFPRTWKLIISKFQILGPAILLSSSSLGAENGSKHLS